MTPEFWRRVEELFQAALERAPEERKGFLDEACRTDADLRQQVELLLAKDVQAKSFLESAPLDDDSMPTATGLIDRQFGPYRVVSLLGAGGMGEVYRAHDSKLGRDVAIKALPLEFARDPERLTRFRREARTLASLNHPSIAAIYGLEESGDADCLVLELVEGETPRGPLPVGDALRIAKQIAEALEAAHDKGIVHRDLKPANVKVTPEGRVKVLDFGLAKAISESEGSREFSHLTATGDVATVAGRIVGTPGYMSPEQARGKEVDRRTDIWAFGCLFYELIAGKRTFQGETVSETIKAVLEQEPDWEALSTKTPASIRELLRRCLQKDISRRLDSIAEARRTIDEAQRGWNRWRVAAVAVAALAAVAIGGVLWLQRPAPLSNSSNWVALTKFPDSVTQPALSPDGRMVAFIRGDSTFFGPGQIYVKIVPDGEPVQLTHDNLEKMSPAFSPDGSRIAYTTVDPGFHWDTWAVPVLGGEPHLLLKNASGLVWTGPGQLLFSEMRMGVHMAVVAAAESRIGQHDVYVPPEEPRMAHRSYLSPDRKWVLLVEMDNDHLWEPCRVVPADGSSEGRKVGPPEGGCTSGAWSRDGKWVYLTSNAVGANHIWRQRFPDGVPEQITSGPTEEDGVAMAPDGRSFVTAVALQNASLWVHDAQGERQISLEGNAADPRFTPDGKKLLYRIVREAPNEFTFYRDPGEVNVADLASGRSEPLVRGFQALDYDISADGRQIVMQIPSPDGKQQLWLAPLDHSLPPRQIPNAEGGAPRFVLSGEILFRRTEGSTAAGTTGFMYRIRADGTGLRKALEAPVLIVNNVSPGGKWLVAWAPLHGDGPPVNQAFSLDGGPPVTIGTGRLQVRSSVDGRASFIQGARLFAGRTYAIPFSFEETLRHIPAGGFRSEEEIMRLPGARRIEAEAVPGSSADVYAFYRGTTQRNLYRVPIP
jgi:eukaryotic-like serine/threonine-protein kinase